MRARLLSGIMFLMIGSLTLFLATCDKTVNSGFEDSIELFSYLEPIEGASNTTMIVNKGNDDNDSYFQVEISDIGTTHLLKNGSHGAWCLEWRKPMRSNNDEHKGVKWYSSIGNPKWKPMNYFFSIKSELEAADPSLTYREFQAVVWSLAGYMGIAPEFDVETLPNSELPGDLRTDGQPNFSKEKVLAIADRVKNEYTSPTKSKATEEEGCIVGETEEDQQNVCVEPEPDIVIETISAGGDHSCGLDNSGNAYCWGQNTEGQLGDGTLAHSNIPVAVLMPDGVSFTTISAGGFHTLALDNTGEAWAWGSNRRGQLGDGGKTTNSDIPVPISMPDGVSFSAISAGSSHSLALGTTGEAWAWGSNNHGQLGNGVDLDGKFVSLARSPIAVIMPEGVIFETISASYSQHSTAISTSGIAYAWGNNGNGQLGDGSTDDSSIPVGVDMPEGIIFSSISAGWLHTVAISSNGEAWGWGWNDAGQLGEGAISEQHNIPVPAIMPEGISFSDISAGERHTMALSSTGEAWTWGLNGSGQLGDGTTNTSTIPTAVKMPENSTFKIISTGLNHSLALVTNGVPWAWGLNDLGQLGDGTTTDRHTPVEVLFPLP